MAENLMSTKTLMLHQIKDLSKPFLMLGSKELLLVQGYLVLLKVLVMVVSISLITPDVSLVVIKNLKEKLSNIMLKNMQEEYTVDMLKNG